MANCKTMMYHRRSSEDSLPGGGGGWAHGRPEMEEQGNGINYSPTQPHLHCQGQQHLSSSSRTKQCYRQNNISNQNCPTNFNDAHYVYVNHYPHTQGCQYGQQVPRQGPASGQVEGSGPNFHPQSTGTHSFPGKEYHEPPPRSWIQLAHSKHKRTCFTVLCYNILCSRYASSSLYSYCPNWALEWNYRRKAILEELVHYAPDIISLQEMETDQFYNFFLPQLQLLGYSGIFGAKSRSRTMVESKRKLVDGCAIFYRTNKFRLLSEHLIEFSQVAIANATRCERISEEMLNRVQTKDNVALVALFETKLDSEQTGSIHGLVAPRPRPLLVCTCHIHWDPNYCDVKLVQTMLLMQELRKITDNWNEARGGICPVKGAQHRQPCVEKPMDTSSSTSVHQTSSAIPSSWDNVNLLICGDFNSLPQSGVLQYMQNGSLSCSHPDFKGLRYEGYLATSGCNVDVPPPSEETNNKKTPGREEEFQHDFQLRSVYPHDALPFTNYTLEFQGVIDYIFHSVQGLRPLGILGPLDTTWLVQHNIVGAPHPCIPSDHLPLLVELEMVPVV